MYKIRKDITLRKNESLNIIPINIDSGCFLTVVCKDKDGELYLEYQDKLIPLTNIYSSYLSLVEVEEDE